DRPQLHHRGVGFQSLTNKIDTTSAGGKLIFHVIASSLKFERSRIVERTNAGLDAAARGVKLGPPEKISSEQGDDQGADRQRPANSADRTSVQCAPNDHLPSPLRAGLAGSF